MKQIDMKRLRKSAALVPLIALSAVAMPACAQSPLIDSSTRTYRVVINHEEQYSIWPVDRENPLGWKDAGFKGTNQKCLDYIEEVWTDMRPLSLRKKLKEENIAKGKAPYKVVINHEEQYSIWLVGQEVTGKWREAGKTCSLKECMRYIEEVWTDMRPLSLRKKMEEDSKQ